MVYLVNKFICILMLNGYKTRAKIMLFRCFLVLKRDFGVVDPFFFFYIVVHKNMFFIKLVPFRKGSVLYRLPSVFKESSMQYQVLHFFFYSAKKLAKQRNISLYRALAYVLYDTKNKQGFVYDKNLQLKKLAMTNRLFLSLRR